MNKLIFPTIVAWLIFCLFLVNPSFVAAQSNDFWRQQQQRQWQQQQQDQLRRQQQDQMRQQQMEQARRQQQEQMRQQQQQAQRRQQEQMRQQQQAQQRQQQQQSQQRQQEQTRQQRQQQQRQNQQQIDQARKAQQAGKPPPAGTSPAIASKPTGPMVFSNGVAKLARPLTPAEMTRGFTGKVTPDGRALVKFQGRVFAVPASRISGLSARLAAEKQRKARWTTQQQAGIAATLRTLTAQKAAAGGAGGRSGPPIGPAPANDNSISANRIAYANFVRTTSGQNPEDLFKHARGWDFSKPIRVKRLTPGTELCQWQANGRKGAYFAPCGTTPSMLGISDKVGTGSGVARIEKRFVVERDLEVLEGTAARVVDDWSIKGQRIETRGGGRQYLIRDVDSESIREI